MRRSLLALCVSLAVGLLSAAPAAALHGSGSWNHVGTNGQTPPGASLNGQVSEMLATPGGLLVGGSFTNAGGIAAADRIAKWDGAHWSALGTTPLADNGVVFAIAAAAGKVFVGGNFTNAGGNAAADYLAVFDGVSWKPFCNATALPGFNAPGLQVLALQVVGPTLYVGGTFQNANGILAADYLIGCNVNTGAMSVTVDHDGDFTGGIYDLAATSDGTLYAAGTFINLDGVAAADRIAAYDGAWHSLGSTDIGGIVRGLHADGMDLYVSTDGLNIGGNPLADHLVRWDGTTYSAVGRNFAGNNGYFPSSATINEITTVGSLVIAAGSWLNGDGDPTGDMIAYFYLGFWWGLGSNGGGNGPFSGEVHGLAVFDAQLYAGGAFTAAGGDPKAMFAASRSLRLPDAVIQTQEGGNSAGRHIYNGAAVGESQTISIRRGTTKAFNVAVYNDGLVPASFRLTGTEAATGYRITYFNTNVEDITDAVRNGDYVTPLVQPHEYFLMFIAVKPSATSASTGSFILKVSSTLHSPKDAVKGIVHATN